MIDHIGLSVSDYDRSKRFYVAALAPLGHELRIEPPAEGSQRAGGFGSGTFWIGSGPNARGATHVAFEARDRAAVDAFYAAALTAGGRDNGAPGVRAHYHPNYYAAFVFDPDGNNIEAVCHHPGAASDQKSF